MRCSSSLTPGIGLVTGASLKPFVEFLAARGAPAEEWMSAAHLSSNALQRSGSLVPLNACYRFIDLAVQRGQLRRLPVLVAEQVSPFELGNLGTGLRQARTVGDYLRIGSGLITTHSNSGARASLTREGEFLRVSLRFAPGPGCGSNIVDVYTLILTLRTLRKILGPKWRPTTVDLFNGSELLLDGSDVPAMSDVTTGAVCTSFTLPIAQLSRVLPHRAAGAGAAPGKSLSSGLPSDFVGSIERLVGDALADGHSGIRHLAEILDTSPRSLQRYLDRHGACYSELLARCRLRLAREWLTMTNKPVAEIAADLGYTDASNFARAFRRATGCSPSRWRSGERIRKRAEAPR